MTQISTPGLRTENFIYFVPLIRIYFKINKYYYCGGEIGGKETTGET